MHRHIRLGGSNLFARGFRKPAHHAQAQPHHGTNCGAFERAIPFARVDLRRPDLDAVAARVLHELRGRIEAHRLTVEQRRAESGRMMALEP
jgi:hypothetical protein